MIDFSKKYLRKGDKPYPDMGNFVHWFILQQKVKKKDVSKHLEVAGTTLNGYFRQPSLQIGIVWKISEAINYNLLADLGQRLEIPFETKAEKALKLQLAEKEEQIKELQTELRIYEKITGAKKD